MTKGDRLTFSHDIVGISGNILFNKEEKVTIREVVKRGGFYGKISGHWIDERIDGVKLQEDDGIWFTSCFKEFELPDSPEQEVDEGDDGSEMLNIDLPF